MFEGTEIRGIIPNVLTINGSVKIVAANVALRLVSSLCINDEKENG